MKKRKKPETKSRKPVVPDPKSAEELARAMFALADKKLPASKRRLTKRLVTEKK